MRAVDTNVLVRLVTRDDRKQVAAAESFVSKGAWVSTLVLMEATWVLTAVYDLTHAEIATAIDMLLHHRDLTIQESDSVAAALEQYRNRPALGFSDCLILETARKAGHLPLGTFDRNLSKLDGAEGHKFNATHQSLLVKLSGGLGTRDRRRRNNWNIWNDCNLGNSLNHDVECFFRLVANPSPTAIMYIRNPCSTGIHERPTNWREASLFLEAALASLF